MSPQQKQEQDKNKQTKPNQNKTNKAKQNKTKQNIYIYIYIYRLDEPHDAFEVHFPIFFYGRQNMFRIKHRPSPVV